MSERGVSRSLDSPSCRTVKCEAKFDEEICADGNLEVHSTP